MYPSYLIHFNKLHSRKNGQFVSGDGDGDGRGDEHHRYTKTGYNTSNNGPPQQVVNAQQLKLAAGIGKWMAGKAFAKTNFGKLVKESHVSDVAKDMVKMCSLDKMYEQSGVKSSVDSLKEKAYQKTANRINKTYNNGGLTVNEKNALKKAGIATGVVAGTVATIGAGKYGLKKLNEHRDAKWKAELKAKSKKSSLGAQMLRGMTAELELQKRQKRKK